MTISCYAKNNYIHCEYQSFEYVHLLPVEHVVGPVYPIPPHCPYKGTVPVAADAELEEVDV
jgi:hypothetical protein